MRRQFESNYLAQLAEKLLATPAAFPHAVSLSDSSFFCTQVPMNLTRFTQRISVIISPFLLF